MLDAPPLEPPIPQQTKRRPRQKHRYEPVSKEELRRGIRSEVAEKERSDVREMKKHKYL
jgi:hypothetical protein